LAVLTPVFAGPVKSSLKTRFQPVGAGTAASASRDLVTKAPTKATAAAPTEISRMRDGVLLRLAAGVNDVDALMAPPRDEEGEECVDRGVRRGGVRRG
jgi:hypothetical protein